MSGYWNAARNLETLDITRYRANSKRVSDYARDTKGRLMATSRKWRG